MANPQKENGHTGIANDILEHLIASDLNGTEMKVALLIIRKTYGWNKKEDEISLSQFMDKIPATKQTICTALERLQLVKIIRLVKKGNSRLSSNTWSFNKDYDNWQLVKKSGLVKVSQKTSQVFSNKLVKKTRHTKDNIQKKYTKEKEDFKKNLKDERDPNRGYSEFMQIGEILKHK
ncbi:MAG: replication protein [Bacteroidota bacterium]|nr:replication protein [Bacteroidota bacterium]